MKLFRLTIIPIIFFAVFGLAKTASADTHTWTGGGADANWSTADNWTPSGPPVAGDAVVFDGNTGTYPNANKAATINQDFIDILSLTIGTSYTGTITQSGNLSITGAYAQTSAATFTSASPTTYTFSVVGASSSFSVTAGFFNRYTGAGTSGTPYVIRDVYDLQGMSRYLTSYFILNDNISASGTSTWNSGAGFVPVGNTTTSFTGNFDGNNKTITGLFINRSSGTAGTGLFGVLGNGPAGPTYDVFNLGLVNVNINSAVAQTGALAGRNNGADINNCYSTITGSDDISGSGNSVGGLVGFNTLGNISSSHSSAIVLQTGAGVYAGGLVGYINSGTISSSYATGNVTGITDIGGLVGNLYGGSVGVPHAIITGSYATGIITGTGNSIGGLVGISNSIPRPDIGTGSEVHSSYSTGSVNGGSSSYYVGGFIGVNDGTIESSYSTGNVTGNFEIGGFAGINAFTITSSYATGSVTPSGSSQTKIGGFVGTHYATNGAGRTNSGSSSISKSYATGPINASSATIVGGFVGFVEGDTITNSYSTGNVTGSSVVGGFAGRQESINYFSTISYAYSTGTVTGSTSGGFIGAYSVGTDTANFWDKTLAGTTGWGSGSPSGITGKTTAEMMTQLTFTGAGWDFTIIPVWRIVPGITYPYLSGMSSNPIIIFGKNIIFGFNMIFKL